MHLYVSIGTQLQPEEVSRVMALQPTRAHSRGHVYVEFGTRMPPTLAGAWLLSTEGQVMDVSLEEHLLWLMDKVRNRKAALKSLQDEHYDIFIHCFVYTDSFWAAEIGAGCLKELSELDIPLRVSASFRREHQ